MGCIDEKYNIEMVPRCWVVPSLIDYQVVIDSIYLEASIFSLQRAAKIG